MVNTRVFGGVLGRDAAYARHGSLYSGGAIAVPSGVYALDLGPLLTLLRWNSERLCWKPQKAAPTGLYEVISDGSNYRIANLTGCAKGVTLITPGSGYSSGTPPVLTTTRTPLRGFNKPTFRALVGGACTMVVDTVGAYHLQPSVVFDVSQQTPPFVTPQFEVQLNNSGQVTGLHQTGNDSGFPSYSGAGLDVSKLTATIIPHPDDSGVTTATVHPVAAGAGVVTQVDCMTFGGPIGDNDFQGTTSVTHNGGSSFTGGIVGEFFVSAYVISQGGQYGSVDSSSIGDFPSAKCIDGMIDDEYGTPREASGTCILTAGVITSVNIANSGGKYQRRPRVAVLPHLTIPSSPGRLTATLGSGNDQYSWQRLA